MSVRGTRRRQEIMRILERNGSATVNELSTLFSVSEMTIRRDLNWLEKENLLKRQYGGALSVPQEQFGEVAYAARTTQNRDLKMQIAAFAAQHFVREGQIIILEGGSTITLLAEQIRHIPNLTILTNGIYVLQALEGHHPSSNIIVSGGMWRTVVNTLVGPVTTQFFSQYQADIAFFSAIGVTLEQGFSDASLLESQAKQDMRRAARKACLVVDSTKFGQRSLTRTFDLHEVDDVVTDANAPPDMVSQLRQHNMQVHVID